MRASSFRSASAIVGAYRLPAGRHLPGINPRPLDDLLERVAALAQGQTCDASARQNIAWLYGIRLLNAEYYWEAHEVLEAVWVRAVPNSRERHLVQTVIHVANAGLKRVLNRQRAARRLSVLACEAAARAFPRAAGVLMGVDATDLAATTRQCAVSTARIKLSWN